MYAALIGAGLTAGGNAMNALGQQQAIDALRKLWADERAKQAGYDAQLEARTQQFLHDLSLGGQLGTDRAAALTGQLDRTTLNGANAVAAQQALRMGGARGGAEARASAAQANQATLATALRDDRVRAMLASLMQGGHNTALLGQAYGNDAGFIRQKAQESQGLLAMGEQAAQTRGQALRQLGSMFNTVGQGAMAYGMSQPSGASGAGGGAIPADGGQAPAGGWAAGRTYDLGGGAMGAWS